MIKHFDLRSILGLVWQQLCRKKIPVSVGQPDARPDIRIAALKATRRRRSIIPTVDLSPAGGEPMREHIATAAAIGAILGVLAPEIDRAPKAEAPLILRLCTGSECALLQQQPVQTATACSIPNCARPEDELIAASIYRP
jgi:hypothetical protein